SESVRASATRGTGGGRGSAPRSAFADPRAFLTSHDEGVRDTEARTPIHGGSPREHVSQVSVFHRRSVFARGRARDGRKSTRAQGQARLRGHDRSEERRVGKEGRSVGSPAE